jgi:putative Mg2+ transporter-C (MgtC) family protein
MPTVHEWLNQVFPNASDTQALVRVTVRLATALVLGGLIGFERQAERKTAGFRTHMMVSLGAALFTVTSLEVSNDAAALTRVIQGVAAGIGFLGAGAILKVDKETEVKGLTTAAGIWLTAGVGMAAGAGQLWTAVVGACMAWIVLGVLHEAERWWKHRAKPPGHKHDADQPHRPPPP